MDQTIFEAARKSAASMGSCDPSWLRNNTEPTFQIQMSGTVGQPMILLHGLFGALSNWEAVTPHFNKFCQTINFGFPIIAGRRDDIKVKALAVYLEYYIRKEKLAPVSLCGNSMGGHVALRLALAAPELVKCLILSGSSGLYEHSVDALPVRPDKKFLREHMARVFFSPKFITESAIDEVHGIVTSKANVLNIISAARSAKKDNLQTLLPKISAPTLLLWGEDDQVTTMEVAEIFHREIRNSKLVTIKGCGHAPMIEHPEWFADQVQRFLRANNFLT